VGTGHVHALYRHGDTPLHRLPPHLKVVAAFGFVFAVVATPREAFWAFAAYAVLLVALATTARLGARFVATRMVIEVPFLLVAFMLPLLGRGDRVDILGLSLSVSGLWGMWNILAKATLGLLISVVLAGTTPIPELLRAFDTLRVPRVITSIMGFMFRYLDVVLGEFRTMRVAMQSRAYHPTWLGQVRPYAQTTGHIFIRSYERGERVFLAMASRGYAGHMPRRTGTPTPAAAWVATLAVPAAAWAVAALAWVTL
jgi:cobalt/nickel transport system permease protein